MKVAIFDKGVCGIEQTFYVGSVNKDTDSTEGTQLPVVLPAGFRLLSFIVNVKSAFSSATLTVTGDQETAVTYLNAATLTTEGVTVNDFKYTEVGEEDVALTAKLSAEETGDGCAEIFVKAVRIEVE